MPRKTTPDQQSQDDSALLHANIQAIIDGMGHGGLSYVAERLGMTPSALRKRLQVPGKAFDAPTLRAAALMLEISADSQLPEQGEDTPAPATP